MVCRQLGFPFGSVFDPEETFGEHYSDSPFEYDERQPEVVWASKVTCTGKEDRLEQCQFPQISPGKRSRVDAGARDLGLPEGGLPGEECSVRDGAVLAVVCRKFSIRGAL